MKVALVIVVPFQDGKVASEWIYWDQASVLIQLGLLEPTRLTVLGAEAARNVLDIRLPLNALIRRAQIATRQGAPSQATHSPQSLSGQGETSDEA